ncbi:globin domain-containing protein [Rhodophyticola porphyridii]|uniref:Hemin receptor n=1 Tax=Rhodophyticola porphyridii TaxID=1852017 RepID=A0A3L9Y216_9RHOB|nr:globin domain-containing protein [Rhodophyticola porphyridii]RMA42492.1 hemin receptor [Rhodophyticola porphyridii]
MKLSEREKSILRESLLRFEEEREAMASLFYANMFKISPNLRPMFGSDIMGQTQKTMLELSAIVAILDDTDACARMIEELALRHIGYGVLPEHYPSVGEALLLTIQQVFGPRFSQEHYATWRAAYAEMSRIMIDAAYPDEKGIAV